MFTAGPVERARGWGSRKPQLTCPCLDSGRSTLKRHVRQRLGCRAGPSPGHSTNPFWPRCWPFCSGSGDAGQSGTAPTYLASGFLLRAPVPPAVGEDTGLHATRPLLRVKAGSAARPQVFGSRVARRARSCCRPPERQAGPDGGPRRYAVREQRPLLMRSLLRPKDTKVFFRCAYFEATSTV